LTRLNLEVFWGGNDPKTKHFGKSILTLRGNMELCLVAIYMEKIDRREVAEKSSRLPDKNQALPESTEPQCCLYLADRAQNFVNVVAS